MHDTLALVSEGAQLYSHQVSILLWKNSSSTATATDMGPPKAWFKLMNWKLTVKATKMIEDVNQAREQDAQQDLVSVLKDCDVIVPDGVPSVQKLFAENIQLFVFAPAMGLTF
ncbi:9688_t:CDS:2 [Paraglomus brasilianum]|uniref:9688_t:CDS:1 n=1 Tax=Paraglomus brasilianum TaxID=144538 RepID=A0A9N9C3N7_9GLOM|nr:9688_t:CDS:2 [Paraglomus brasilianum]